MFTTTLGFPVLGCGTSRSTDVDFCYVVFVVLQNRHSGNASAPLAYMAVTHTIRLIFRVDVGSLPTP